MMYNMSHLVETFSLFSRAYRRNESVPEEPKVGVKGLAKSSDDEDDTRC